ncbi:hypothetical protein [Shewanella algae]|uniref:hypothetical protein n=1 Tax=Shewanella algae TaxID=38313 RepID=UPI0013DDB98A|nr:hypothetical protein [Shewanella algae]
MPLLWLSTLLSGLAVAWMQLQLPGLIKQHFAGHLPVLMGGILGAVDGRRRSGRWSHSLVDNAVFRGGLGVGIMGAALHASVVARTLVGQA